MHLPAAKSTASVRYFHIDLGCSNLLQTLITCQWLNKLAARFSAYLANRLTNLLRDFRLILQTVAQLINKKACKLIIIDEDVCVVLADLADDPGQRLPHF